MAEVPQGHSKSISARTYFEEVDLATYVMRLQPTSASRTYTVRRAYQEPKHPRIMILDPELELYPGTTRLPHVYSGDQLCLYTPGEWDHYMLDTEPAEDVSNFGHVSD